MEGKDLLLHRLLSDNLGLKLLNVQNINIFIPNLEVHFIF